MTFVAHCMIVQDQFKYMNLMCSLIKDNCFNIIMKYTSLLIDFNLHIILIFVFNYTFISLSFFRNMPSNYVLKENKVHESGS